MCSMTVLCVDFKSKREKLCCWFTLWLITLWLNIFFSAAKHYCSFFLQIAHSVMTERWLSWDSFQHFILAVSKRDPDGFWWRYAKYGWINRVSVIIVLKHTNLCVSESLIQWQATGITCLSSSNMSPCPFSHGGFYLRFCPNVREQR